jgi:hypothetical protein
MTLPLNPPSGDHVFGFLSFSSIMHPVNDEQKSGGLGVKI